MPLLQKIGSTLYLYRMLDTGFCDDVVITAHGGYYPTTAHFDVPALPSFEGLFFYVPHGTVQTDFGIGGFAGVERKVVDPIAAPGTDCWDYLLSKYQGRHSNNAETYDSIERDMNATTEAVRKHAKGLSNLKTRAVYEKKSAPRIFDVVTIRNRVLSGDQNLRSVLTRVMQVNVYRRIHCYFCRSPIS